MLAEYPQLKQYFLQQVHWMDQKHLNPTQLDHGVQVPDWFFHQQN